MTHFVEVEVEDEGTPDAVYTVVRFTCNAPEGSLCRAWCVEPECEEVCHARDVYVSDEPDGTAARHAPEGAHRFAPIASCRVADYLNVGDAHDREELHGEDEPLRPGVHPIVEEWDGDCYLWTYAEPESEPAYPGHP